MDWDRLQRVALYARYSSDGQSEASIEDQLRVCRSRAEREGWQVAGMYTDATISGQPVCGPGTGPAGRSSRQRPRPRIGQSLDRFSRDQEHIAAFYKQTTFAGVRIVTLAEGEVSELHTGLKGHHGCALPQGSRR